jgi:hypothetical protein
MLGGGSPAITFGLGGTIPLLSLLQRLAGSWADKYEAQGQK